MRGLLLLLLPLAATACGGAPLPALIAPSVVCADHAPEGVVQSAMLTITHEQRFTGAKITHLVYAFDGAAIFQKTDPSGIAPPVTVFHGSVAPGQHTLTFFVELDGAGRHATIRARHTFTSAPGTSQQIVPDLEGKMSDVDHAKFYVRDFDCSHTPPPGARGNPEEDLSISLGDGL